MDPLQNTDPAGISPQKPKRFLERTRLPEDDSVKRYIEGRRRSNHSEIDESTPPSSPDTLSTSSDTPRAKKPSRRNGERSKSNPVPTDLKKEAENTDSEKEVYKKAGSVTTGGERSSTIGVIHVQRSPRLKIKTAGSIESRTYEKETKANLKMAIEQFNGYLTANQFEEEYARIIKMAFELEKGRLPTENRLDFQSSPVRESRSIIRDVRKNISPLKTMFERIKILKEIVENKIMTRSGPKAAGWELLLLESLKKLNNTLRQPPILNRFVDVYIAESKKHDDIFFMSIISKNKEEVAGILNCLQKWSLSSGILAKLLEFIQEQRYDWNPTQEHLAKIMHAPTQDIVRCFLPPEGEGVGFDKITINDKPIDCAKKITDSETKQAFWQKLFQLICEKGTSLASKDCLSMARKFLKDKEMEDGVLKNIVSILSLCTINCWKIPDQFFRGNYSALFKKPWRTLVTESGLEIKTNNGYDFEVIQEKVYSTFDDSVPNSKLEDALLRTRIRWIVSPAGGIFKFKTTTNSRLLHEVKLELLKCFLDE